MNRKQLFSIFLVIFFLGIFIPILHFLNKPETEGGAADTTIVGQYTKESPEFIASMEEARNKLVKPPNKTPDPPTVDTISYPLLFGTGTPVPSTHGVSE